MSIHETIKNRIKEAMRSKDTLTLDTLRGLNALFLNDMLQDKSPQAGEFISDEKASALIRKSVKQRKDSIEQFMKGGRIDLADKEKAELSILESYLPRMMSLEEIKTVVAQKIQSLKENGQLDVKAVGKITGMIMKDLSGKADGGDVKKAIEEMIKNA